MKFELSPEEKEAQRDKIRAEPWYREMSRLIEEIRVNIDAANRAFGFDPADLNPPQASSRRR